MEFKDKLRLERKKRKLSQTELANMTGVNLKTISRYELGKASQVKFKMIQRICEAFKTTPLNFLEDVDDPYLKEMYNAILLGKLPNTLPSDKNELTSLEVLGSVPAGVPVEAIEDIRGHVWVDMSKYYGNPTLLALEVKGDSMYPFYLPGDTIIIEKTFEFKNGQDVVVYVNGYEATLKTIFKNPDGSITLKPKNPMYQEMTYGIDDEEIMVLGVVRELRRSL